MATVTETPLQISYFVADIATALTTYNRIRWHRSRSGQNGAYSPATSATATAASITGTLTSPHQLSGKTFIFKVNGTEEVTVTFPIPDPVTTAEVITGISGETALAVGSDTDGKLTITTVATGSDASIEILGGDANEFLGFSEGDGAVGTDADTTLVAGTHEYFWIDENASTDWWYRVEFLHSTTAKTSGLGVPFSADQATTVSKSRTVVAYIRMADPSGMPIPGRRVFLSNVYVPNTVIDLTYNWGIFRNAVEMTTDRNGYASIRLVRGMVLDLSIDGTAFVRRITIPTTGDSVDLLDTALVAEDEFGVQEPNINYAIRTV